MLAFGNGAVPRPVVFFVGLSAKPNCEHLDGLTTTGSIVSLIVDRLPDVTAVKTNLVKSPPVDGVGKLRYPTAREMQAGWLQLEADITAAQPNLVVTLGIQVSCFLRLQLGIHPTKPRLPSYWSSNSYLAEYQGGILSVHHPSFVYVYRRKQVGNYVTSVVTSIKSLVV